MKKKHTQILMKNKFKSFWQKFKAVPTLNVAELVFFYSCKITPTSDDNLFLPIMSITYHYFLTTNFQLEKP